MEFLAYGYIKNESSEFGHLLDICRGVQNGRQSVFQSGSNNCLLGDIPIVKGPCFLKSHRETVIVLCNPSTRASGAIDTRSKLKILSL